jgi:hypothetical protein
VDREFSDPDGNIWATVKESLENCLSTPSKLERELAEIKKGLDFRKILPSQVQKADLTEYEVE